ncbi:PAS domain S-box protein [Dictyobacter kobayashii]|uniref:histidine kinase n=1 Tax=Dictyobacter kobayashii TaxID=2014872 RepID=A0A402AQX2_9CHLR|nr:PAS domain S-box protein [Dictyobacter kobayashii]GCE21496.1 hypothetical protein KDK_52960 [Dictyobacter kobayashii]
MQQPQHKNLLVVDDNPEDRIMIHRYLSLCDQSINYTIHEASNGKQGLLACQNFPFDCVLLDYNLPDMTGIAFLDKLRIEIKRPFLPVVVFTGCGSEMIAVQSMKRGAQDYVIKEQLSAEKLCYTILNAIEKLAMQKRLEEQWLELDQQRHAFQMLAENAPDIIVRFDPEFRYLYANPAMMQTTGLAVESLLGKTNREIGMPEDFCVSWEERLAEVLATGKVAQLEYELASSAGRRFFQARLAPEFNTAGQVISILGISRDVTDIKTTESALREREEQLRLVFSTASIGSWDWNLRTGEIIWSEELKALLGLAPGSFHGTFDVFIALVHPADRVMVEQLLQQALVQKKEYQAEFRMLRMDGSLRWTIARGRIFYDEDGRPMRMMGIDLDITERKQAEQQATEQANELEAFLEAISDGLFILDALGNPVRLNRAARQLLGIPTGKLSERLSVPPVAFFNEQGSPLPAEQRPEARLLHGEHLVGSSAAEIRLQHESGREIELNVTGAPLTTEDGEVSGAIMVTRDVTARRQLERRTQTALDALLLMAESLISCERTSTQTEETIRVVLQHLIELVCRVLGCEGAILVMLDAATGKIEYGVGTGFDSSVVSTLHPHVQGAALSDYVQEPELIRQLQAGNAVLLDVSQPPYLKLQLRSHLHQAMLVPLCLHDKLVGIMTLYPPDPHHLYLAEEITLAVAIGKLVTLVIERERLLREREVALASELAALEATQRMNKFIGVASHELRTP